MARNLEIDWKRQHLDFEADGSLRELHVEDCSEADWMRVIQRMGGSGSLADLRAQRAELTLELEGVTYGLLVVGGDHLVVDFEPKDFGPAKLAAVIGFVADLGDLLGKPVALCPEGLEDDPIYRYDPVSQKGVIA